MHFTTPAKPLLIIMGTFSLGAVAIALLSQYVWGMPPCAWCVLQRLIYLLIALVCWLGVATPAILARMTAILATILSVGGALAAWYQYSVAAQMFSCDQTFADKFMTASGLEAGVPWLFGIYASCMDAQVRILGIEYSILSLILFIVLGFMGVQAAARKPPEPDHLQQKNNDKSE